MPANSDVAVRVDYLNYEENQVMQVAEVMPLFKEDGHLISRIHGLLTVVLFVFINSDVETKEKEEIIELAIEGQEVGFIAHISLLEPFVLVALL